MFTTSDAVDLLRGGCDRGTLKSRTNFAKEQWHPEGAGGLLGKAGVRACGSCLTPPGGTGWRAMFPGVLLTELSSAVVYQSLADSRFSS